MAHTFPETGKLQGVGELGVDAVLSPDSVLRVTHFQRAVLEPGACLQRGGPRVEHVSGRLWGGEGGGDWRVFCDRSLPHSSGLRPVETAGEVLSGGNRMNPATSVVGTVLLEVF